MSGHKSLKVVFDTNIWISFLIGRRLQNIKDLISAQHIALVFSEQLLLELTMVTQRPKLKKYFPEQRVEEFIEFLRAVGQIHEADFLVTGDKDLLVLNP